MKNVRRNGEQGMTNAMRKVAKAALKTAYVGAGLASCWGIFQPKVPEKLRREN